MPRAKTCQDFGLEWGCKSDGPETGVHTVQCAEKVIIEEIEGGEEGLTFASFQVQNGETVDLVAIKGGPGYEVYDYRPDGIDYDVMLGAPEGKDISHILYCWDSHDGPPDPPPPVPTMPLAGLILLAVSLGLIVMRIMR